MQPAQLPDQGFDILVVEEEEETVNTMSQLLASVATLRHARSGQGAFLAIEEKAPDLVMLSAALPDVDGFAVCARIRQSSTVPILMMSKTWTDKQELRGLKIGADGFLHQPYNSQLLAINAIAQLRRAYKYDSQPKPSEGATQGKTTVPAGWTMCDVCGYMGPQQKFEKTTQSGQIKRVCPHCGEEASATYSVG